VTVETDMTDIGTGSYTIIAQTAAEMMGVPLEQVLVRLGDSSFPTSCGSGGQWGGNNSTAGVYAACMKLREAVAQKAGLNAADAVFADGRCAPAAAACRWPRQPATAAWSRKTISNTATSTSVTSSRPSARISLKSASMRDRRDPRAAHAGRLRLGPHPQPQDRAQPGDRRDDDGRGRGADGGAGGGHALGYFVNHDLAGYEVPVHADIPHQDVIFLDETDPISSPMKAKGVGELGICGVGAAVANAVYNATGVRVRDYPITLDKSRLPVNHADAMPAPRRRHAGATPEPHTIGRSRLERYRTDARPRTCHSAWRLGSLQTPAHHTLPSERCPPCPTLPTFMTPPARSGSG
jgi:xanthine dehydrogenase YagR molybdenum-binding subunit